MMTSRETKSSSPASNVRLDSHQVVRARYSTVHLEQLQQYGRLEMALRVTSNVLKSKDIIDGSIAEGKHGELSLYCG
jgi:hypothetical protein